MFIFIYWLDRIKFEFKHVASLWASVSVLMLDSETICLIQMCKVSLPLSTRMTGTDLTAADSKLEINIHHL